MQIKPQALQHMHDIGAEASVIKLSFGPLGTVLGQLMTLRKDIKDLGQGVNLHVILRRCRMTGQQASMNQTKPRHMNIPTSMHRVIASSIV